jgi:O-antigen ligase
MFELKKIINFYHIFGQILFLLIPLLFLIPFQFKQNLYLNPIFWIIIISGVLISPVAISHVVTNLKSKILRLFLIYLIFLGILTIFSSDIGTSSAILFLNLSYAGFFLSSNYFLSEVQLKKVFINIFLGVATLLSIISFWNLFIYKYINLEKEGISFMWIYYGHNHLAVLLIIAIPILFFKILDVKKYLHKYLILTLEIFLIFSLLITFSRGAIIALIMAYILGVIIFRFRKKITTFFMWLFIPAILIIFALVFTLILKSSTGIESRIGNISKGIEMFIEKPLIGFGPGTFNNYTKSEVKHVFFAHNLFIQTISEQGLIGLLTLSFLLISLFVKEGSRINKLKYCHSKFFYISLWIGCLGVICNEFVDFDLQLPSLGLFFWILHGLLYQSYDFSIRTIEKKRRLE